MNYIGYPTPETADIIINRMGELEDGYPCLLIDKAVYPQGIKISLDDAVAYVEAKGFSGAVVQSLIIDFHGLCIDTQRHELRGHMKRPDDGLGLYDTN